MFLRFRDRARAAGIEVPIVPGILPVTNFAQLKRMAAACGASIPAWMGAHFDGLDDDPDTRRLVAASLTAEQCRRLQANGVHEFHFYTLEPRRPARRDLPPARRARPQTRRSGGVMHDSPRKFTLSPRPHGESGRGAARQLLSARIPPHPPAPLARAPPSPRKAAERGFPRIFAWPA